MIKRIAYKIIRKFVPKQIRYLVYKGTTYLCPFCNKQFRKMLPGRCKHPQVLIQQKVVGAGPNPNNLCPYCFSGSRERSAYLSIKDMLNENLSVLHIAPEKHIKELLQHNDEYVSGDIGSGIDVRKLQWPKNTFDAVICNHVLEHVDDDKKALSEIYRVLKPKGWALLQVPISLALKKTFEDKKINTPESREEFYGQRDHVRLYAQDYKNRLEKAGFRVEVGTLDDYTKGRYSLIKEEKIYLCIK